MPLSGTDSRELIEEYNKKEKILDEEYKGSRPPIWLKSEEKVVVNIVDGRIKSS